MDMAKSTRLVLGGLLVIGFGLIVLRRVDAPEVAMAGPATSGGFDLQAVTLVFGQKDAKPTKWNGSATISAGAIEKIAGYHFTRESKIDGARWECATNPWPAH